MSKVSTKKDGQAQDDEVKESQKEKTGVLMVALAGKPLEKNNP